MFVRPVLKTICKPQNTGNRRKHKNPLVRPFVFSVPFSFSCSLSMFPLLMKGGGVNCLAAVARLISLILHLFRPQIHTTYAKGFRLWEISHASREGRSSLNL